MDIKAKVDEIIAKFKSDPQMLEKFQKDPHETVKTVTGADVPDDVLHNIINGIKEKFTGGFDLDGDGKKEGIMEELKGEKDKIAAGAGGLLNKLFHKK